MRTAEQGALGTANGHKADSESGEDAMMVDTPPNQKGRAGKEVIPEVEIYICVLIQARSYKHPKKI